MSEGIKSLNLELDVKSQWYCDFCGEVIDSAKDGMLEWDSFVLEEGREFTAENFRIVHHRAVKDCRPPHADKNLSDGHLHWYTGPHGLSDLLDIETRHRLDTIKFHNIIRRLHVDYYEEARTYLPQAREDGYNEIDPYDLGDISEHYLKWLIKKYGKRQY
ncbi:hypothetical protein [Rossellomorea marisflavi]|uniref:hypothetical protein n=1 Tax=Rossellomorea marisflavi TaxID=189381 RepID=UPI00064EDC30|nr:hypothetical protein [Rossellomorea marisflavi]KML07133.1 hypothetical protein VL06_04195 [Rossellomorea marisflavi]